MAEKEGYEEMVTEPPDFEDPRPSTSKGLQEGSSSLPRTSSWKLGLATKRKEEEEEEDPTTFAATIKKLRQEKKLEIVSSASR